MIRAAKRRSIITIVWLLAVAIPAFPEILSWKTITNQSTVEDIAVVGDSLLLATSGGIVVFDRKKEAFVASFTNTEGLSANHPIRVVVDRSGNWWAGMASGDLNRYDLKRETWDYFPDFSRFQLHDMMLSGDSLFVALHIGISLFLISKEEAKETYQNLGDFPVASDVFCAAIFQNALWVGTDDGLAYADLNQVNLKAPQSWRNLTVDDGLLPGRITALLPVGDTLWIGTERGMQWYTPEGLKIPSGMPAEPVTGMAAGKKTVFVAFDHRLYRYNRQTGEIEYLTWVTPQIHAIGMDPEGTVWLGTEGEGLLKVDPVSGDTKQYLPDGPAGNQFGDLAVDGEGRLWCASSALYGAGIYRYDGTGWTNFNTRKGNLPSDQTVAVAATPAGDVWVGTWGGGVFRFHHGEMEAYTAQTGHVFGIPENVGYAVINEIAVDRLGTVWMANFRAYNGTRLIAVTPDLQWAYFTVSDGLPSANVTSIAVDLENRKWIGTDGNGVYVYDDKYTPLDLSDDEIVLRLTTADGLESGNVTAVAVDSLNTVWIATTGGLNAYQAGRVFTMYGLITNDIRCVEVDPVGNKWVGTSLGLSILKDDITWEHYTTENSPLPAPTVESVAFNPITGQAFVGTTAGLSVLETTLIRPAVKMERLNVYPNPFHLSETGGATHLTIDGLARDAAVGIYTAQGNLVRKLSAASASGRILWDGRDQNGEYVPSGVYLVVAVDPAGKSVATKVAVLRK